MVNCVLASLPASPHSGIGIPSQSSRSPFAMRSMDQHVLRPHGPPKPLAPLPLPQSSEAAGAARASVASALVPADADLGDLAAQAPAISVESSEASPHCFLVCIGCGLERSLLLPMPAHDFQAAMGSFASSHRACHR